MLRRIAFKRPKFFPALDRKLFFFFIKGADISAGRKKMEIIEKMKNVMEEKGLTEQQLADAIGVSKGAMHNWMKGVGKPSANAVQKFEKYCESNGSAE